MAVKNVVTCDKCGTEKKESNHWIMFRPSENPAARLGVLFLPWDQTIMMDFSHACGVGCATKVLSQYFGENHAVDTHG